MAHAEGTEKNEREKMKYTEVDPRNLLTTNGIAQRGDFLGAVSANGLHG